MTETERERERDGEIEQTKVSVKASCPVYRTMLLTNCEVSALKNIKKKCGKWGPAQV